MLADACLLNDDALRDVVRVNKQLLFLAETLGTAGDDTEGLGSSSCPAAEKPPRMNWHEDNIA